MLHEKKDTRYGCKSAVTDAKQDSLDADQKNRNASVSKKLIRRDLKYVDPRKKNRDPVAHSNKNVRECARSAVNGATVNGREKQGKRRFVNHGTNMTFALSDAVNNRAREAAKDVANATKEEIHTLDLEIRRLKDRNDYLQQNQANFDGVKSKLEAEKQKVTALLNKVIEENRSLSVENRNLQEQLIEKDKYAEKLVRRVHELEIYSRKLSEEIKVITETNEKVISQLHILEDQKRAFNKTFETSNEELRRMMREKTMIEKKFADNERECSTLRGTVKLKTAEAERCAAEIQKKKIVIEQLSNENRELKEKLNTKEVPTTRKDIGLY